MDLDGDIGKVFGQNIGVYNNECNAKRSAESKESRRRLDDALHSGNTVDLRMRLRESQLGNLADLPFALRAPVAQHDSPEPARPGVAVDVDDVLELIPAGRGLPPGGLIQASDLRTCQSSIDEYA